MSACGFKPEENEPSAVYGPPEMMTSSQRGGTESPETDDPNVAGTEEGDSDVTDPEEFDPSENMEEDVYGPPQPQNVEDGAEEGEE